MLPLGLFQLISIFPTTSSTCHIYICDNASKKLSKITGIIHIHKHHGGAFDRGSLRGNMALGKYRVIASVVWYACIEMKSAYIYCYVN
ncbi:hypothetical protein ACJX0J_028875, partial [Zea mays]